MDIELDDTLPQSQVDQFLPTIQGNILEGHGRDRALHVFIQFQNPVRARRWIRRFVTSGAVTNALEQRSQSKNEIFRSFLLSHAGYRKLGERGPRERAYCKGLRARGEKLSDAPVEDWEAKYRDHAAQVHGLLILASNDETALAHEMEISREVLDADSCRVLFVEAGQQQRHRDHHFAIEHFGYRDGVSQPIFIEPTPLPKGSDKFDQRTALKRVLVEDPNADDTYGSYFVFRKLEQNVVSWQNALAQVSSTLSMGEELVGAMAVGRFKNGTPVVSSGTSVPNYNPAEAGEFDYGADGNGSRCPFHAHVRKTNPRGEVFLEDTRRIARRGITYGERPDLDGNGPAPTGDVGLLFMCFQSDIADQFEFIQRRWSNSENFEKRGTGVDPVIGQVDDKPKKKEFPNWPTSYGSDDRKRVVFGEHVRLRGGEYFFAPSIAGLRRLGDGS